MRSYPAQIGLGFGSSGEASPPVPNSTIPSVIAKNILREMLARSGTFQAAIGATGTTAQKIAAAKLRIHLSTYINDDMERPFAVICKNESDKNNSIGGGESQQFLSNGSLEARFERVIPDEFLETLEDESKGDIAAGSEGDAEDDFEDFYEGCIADINALAGTEGYLFIRGWDTIEGPTIYQSSGEQAKVYAIRKKCDWGIE